MSTAASTTTRRQRPSTLWSEIVGTVVIAGGLIAYAQWDKHQTNAAYQDRVRVLSPAEITAAMAPLSQPVRECMNTQFGDGNRQFRNGAFQDSIELCQQSFAESQRQAERVRALKAAVTGP